MEGIASGRGDRCLGGHLASAAGEQTLPAHEYGLAALFERVPHGLAVFRRGGALVAMNGAFIEMADLASGTSPADVVCCSVLCDRRPEGGDPPGCIVDALLASDTPIHDVCLELPAEGGAAWLSGARLGGDEEMAVVEVRRGVPVALAAPAAPIRLRVLCRMRVETDAGPVSGGWLDERPGQLLKFLVAARRRIVTVEDIAEAIWPTAEFATVGTVRHLVHVLRGRLEPGRRARAATGASCIVSSRGGYTLDLDRVVVDADEFAAAAERALTAFSAGDEACEGPLEDALARYDGDFLGDELYADWAHAERERLRGLAERLLWALSDLAVARGDLAAATTYSERLTALEPFDSDLQRQLIQLLLRDGRRGRALREYQAFALRLQRAFGERPEFGLDELVRDAAAAARRDDARLPPATAAGHPLG
jgi:DNA-binding SARP family transcriptional activator